MKHLQNRRTILLHVMPARAAAADFAGASHIVSKTCVPWPALGCFSGIQLSGESGCRS